MQAPPSERLPRPRGAPEGEPPGAEAHDESVCSLFARRVLDEPASVGPHLLRYRSRLEVSNDTPMLRATSARKHVCKHVCQKRNEAPKDFPTSLSSPTSSLFEMGSTFARGQDRLVAWAASTTAKPFGYEDSDSLHGKQHRQQQDYRAHGWGANSPRRTL